LVVDKPAGVVVHPTHKHAAGTLMNALLWHARAWPTGSRPSIVGRLDKLTSGVVIVAKTAAVHAAVQREWAATRTVKDYLALVYGRIGARGQIDLALRRDPADRRRVVASAATGAPSRTRFERIARVRASPVGLALVRCRLLTGRTHQIRVHLASTGWPIVGDPVYGEPRWKEIADVELAAALARFPRQALHAWRVAVAHPVTGEMVRAEAPIPSDLASLLATAGVGGRVRWGEMREELSRGRRPGAEAPGL
ncbi:MAG TPA: RluA family pseudouridine synthase, partial [Gemmataceae bacterium]|nr:RluA family pseudouridine synthase [Gemmataceae bacterium]